MIKEPLANTLRPTKLSEVIGQEHLVGKDKILTNLVKNKKLFSMILYGPPGTGKTSLANAITSELDCKTRFLNAVVNNNVIPKIIVGSSNNSEYTNYNLSATVLKEFYKLDDACTKSNTSGCQKASKTINENMQKLQNGKMPALASNINETVGGWLSDDNDVPAINFDHGLFAIGVGGFMAYVLILYSIDLGIRYAQILFLQIIAPIAIMSYILPKKDGMFSIFIEKRNHKFLKFKYLIFSGLSI